MAVSHFTKMNCHYAKSLSYLILLVALFIPFSLLHAAQPSIAPEDLRLLRAVKVGDVGAVKQALRAGGHLQQNAYESPLTPIDLAVLFDQVEVLPILIVNEEASDYAYFASILNQKVAIFRKLLTIRAPSKHIISGGLTLFADRAPVFITELLKIAVNEPLGEAQPPTGELSLSTLLESKAHLSSLKAPELWIAEKLRQLGSNGNGEGLFTRPVLQQAVANGDVFYADWLVSKRLGKMNNALREDLLRGVVSTGFIEGFEELIKRGQQPRQTKASGVDLLEIAAARGNSTLVDRLLEVGVKANAPLRASEPQPLLVAARGGYLNITRRLLSAGAAANLITGNAGWPLREATRGGHVEVVSLLLSAGADAKLKDSKGNTALHHFTNPDDESKLSGYLGLFAPRKRIITPRHVNTTRLLVQAGLDINATNLEGKSVLGSMLSGEQIEPEFWAELIKLGAQIDASCYQAIVNRFSLPVALANWFFNVAGADKNYRLPPPTNLTLLEYANQKYFFDTLEKLITIGAALPASPEEQESLMWTLLRHASKLLAPALANGLSPNLRIDGRPAVEWAIEHSDSEIVRLLLDAGADVNVAGRDTDGGSILHSLVIQDVDDPGKVLTEEQLASVSMLIDSGLDLRRKDKHGRTVFDLAKDSSPTREFLQRAVAHAGSSTDPIHIAVRHGDLVRLQSLVQSGASLEAKDSLGRTPLSVALTTSQVAIARYLLRNGATFSVTADVPGVPADITFATDKRYSWLFHPRLLATSIVDAVRSPTEDVKKIHESTLFRPGPIEWQITCRPNCPGKPAVLKDNDTKAYGLLRSEREDTDGSSIVSANIPYVTEHNVKGDSLAAAFFRKLIREAFWTIRGSWTIDGCPFTFENPLCFPEVAIDRSYLEGGSLSIKGLDLDLLLKDGESMTVDRSAGPITITLNPVEGYRPRLMVGLSYAIRPSIDFSEGRSFEARMENYKLLTELRAQREQLLAKGDRPALVRAKSLSTAIREISARAAHENYVETVLQLFEQSARQIVTLDQRVLDLRAILQSQLAFPIKDIELMIQSLDNLIKADPHLTDILTPIRNALEQVLRTGDASHVATGKAIENLFSDIDRAIFEYQGFGLELAQFLSAEGLEAAFKDKEILIPSQRETIRKRLRGTEKLIHDKAFNEHGAQIKQLLELP